MSSTGFLLITATATAHNLMAVRGYEMKLESTRGPLLTLRFA